MAIAALCGILKIMPHHHARRRKVILSPHQKQIRFLTWASVCLCAVLATVVFWFVSRPSYPLVGR
jgi:hypothetical protein